MNADPSPLLADGEQVRGPEGVAVRNYTEGVYRFSGEPRRGPVTEIVVHETVSRSVDETVRAMCAHSQGTHLILGPEGDLTQHGDLVTDCLAHAGAHDRTSFGVDVINPYYPTLMRSGEPWSRTLGAPWAHGQRYVLPTPAQAETLCALIRWATSTQAHGIEVPRRWVGFQNGVMRMSQVAAAQRPTPGILANHYFGHAYGAWLVLYAWLRIEAGLDPEAAFEEAARRATGIVGSVDLHDFASPSILSGPEGQS